MPTLLSRIEREYVLKTLRETLPAFTVLSGTHVATIPDRSYSCEGDRILLIPLSCGPLDDMAALSLRLCFYHRQRGVFFDLPDGMLKNGILSFSLPEKVYLEDRERPADCRQTLVCTFKDSILRAEAIAAFPLDSILPDPSVIEAKKNALEKVSRRSGITGESFAATYRLYEYLESVSRQGRGELDARGAFLYADHRFAIASFAVGKAGKASIPSHETPTSLEMEIGGRKIATDARVSGIIPVAESLSACCLSFVNLKEEDKRFLFERLYRAKYQ